MNIRETIGVTLAEALPAKSYLVVASERPVATIDRRTVIVSQQGFTPFADSPLTHLTVRFIVRVLSPITGDIAKAEDDLTDAVSDVCFAIEDLDGVTWTDATKVLHNNYLGYDITVEATVKKKEA
ncbi:MAG: hypothetical protein CMF56_01280 [Leifsonia sp.]|nr:hypothetical protein [Leifsonia sp.]|tara:strand:- start:25245 stop:25619 length:375 start_codon:yes stop_codon:yes gene_type:complete